MSIVPIEFPILLIGYAVLGLIIGSFLNVCVYRIPLGKSIVFPGSSCPSCGQPIRAYDNIPVLSFLLLRGKCRFCGHRISIQYPFVELLTGAAFLACAWRWEFSAPTFVNSLLLSIVIVLVFIDYRHQILPNVLTLPGAVAGMLLSSFQDFSFYSDALSVRMALSLPGDRPQALLPWIGSLVGALLASGVLWLIGFAFRKLRHKEGLGMGDIKMMAMVGAFLGWPLASLTVFAGAFLGTFVGVFLILFRNKNMQTKLPFGVFLGIGTALSLFYGLPFLRWYLAIAR